MPAGVKNSFAVLAMGALTERNQQSSLPTISLDKFGLLWIVKKGQRSLWNLVR